MTPNEKAFLDMIAYSEIGESLLAHSDNGYNVLVGGTLFNGYADHPRKLVLIGEDLKSTAAGRYQLLARYFDSYKHLLHLTDFSPQSQDLIALQQIKECHALEYINDGHFELAVQKCARIWASLPSAGYGQHENKMEDLKFAYVKAGGSVS